MKKYYYITKDGVEVYHLFNKKGFYSGFFDGKKLSKNYSLMEKEWIKNKETEKSLEWFFKDKNSCWKVK